MACNICSIGFQFTLPHTTDCAGNRREPGSDERRCRTGNGGYVTSCHLESDAACDIGSAVAGLWWHQISVAYMRVSNYFPGLVWSRSVHNIVIDFLLWNGLSFLSYFAWFGFQLNKYVNSVESVIGLFMVSALLIHGMLEFPLFYSYFLLPAGFILGILLSQKKQILHSCICLRIICVSALPWLWGDSAQAESGDPLRQ